NDGNHAYRDWVTDNENTAYKLLRSVEFRRDICNSSSSDNADADWHNSAVTVHLAASDPLAGPALTDSGVKNIKYSVDGGATQTVDRKSVVEGMSAPASPDNDGEHTTRQWEADNALN